MKQKFWYIQEVFGKEYHEIHKTLADEGLLSHEVLEKWLETRDNANATYTETYRVWCDDRNMFLLDVNFKLTRDVEYRKGTRTHHTSA